MRGPWRLYLPSISQQVVASRPRSVCGQMHNLRRAPSLQDCHNRLVRSDADPLPVYVSFLSWGTLRVTCIHPCRSEKLTWQIFSESATIAFLHRTRAATTTTASASTAWPPGNDFGTSTLDAARLLLIQRHERQAYCFGTRMWLHLHED